MKRFLTVLFMVVLILSSVAARPAPQPTGFTIPVLCYHSIPTVSGDHYSTKLSVFQEEMAYLNRNGYTTLSAEEYYAIMNGQATAPQKPILLTFDDGYSDFFSNALPVLQQYNMKAIAFVVSDWLNQPGKLTSDQLRQLAAGGIDIQNHTTAHDYLSRMTTDQLVATIGGCNDVVYQITGVRPQYLAYPYGDYDVDTITAAKSLGIKMAFKVGDGLTSTTDDQFSLGRVILTNSDTLTSFIRKIA